MLAIKFVLLDFESGKKISKIALLSMEVTGFEAIFHKILIHDEIVTL